MKKQQKQEQFIWVLGIVMFTLIFIASSVIFKIFDFEVLPSQFFGALIGVVITAIITVFLLRGQSAQEMQRDKDVKIFEQKIQVYSEFTEKMWGMFDDSKLTDDELRALRDICFRKLVFYLDHKQIMMISEQIESIRDTSMKAAGEITQILQKHLNSNNDVTSGVLVKLFNSFDKKKLEENEMSIEDLNTPETANLQQDPSANYIRYWHFNILYEEQQIKAFKDNNWVLALIEYGEEWRTNALKQVKKDDVIFLFKRGGSGYIGAFRALDPPAKILEAGKSYTNIEIKKYDIYDGLEDGASLCSNLRVEPIAYNYLGVGYYTVRRRTIERMNDYEAVKFLLNKFNGKELNEEQRVGMGFLDSGNKVELNSDYFVELLKINNL